MNKDSENTRVIGFIVAFIGSILFSTKAIIVKRAFADEHVDALTLLMIRMLFSLPFYLVTAVYIFRQSSNVKMTSKDWVITIGLGLFGYYLSSLLDFIGLQYISAGLERLILFFVSILCCFDQCICIRTKNIGHTEIGLITELYRNWNCLLWRIEYRHLQSRFFPGKFFGFSLFDYLCHLHSGKWQDGS